MRKFVRLVILGLCHGVTKGIVAVTTSLFHQKDLSGLKLHWTLFLKPPDILVLIRFLVYLRPCCSLDFHSVVSLEIDKKVKTLTHSILGVIFVWLVVFFVGGAVFVCFILNKMSSITDLQVKRVYASFLCLPSIWKYSLSVSVTLH